MTEQLLPCGRLTGATVHAHSDTHTHTSNHTHTCTRSLGGHWEVEICGNRTMWFVHCTFLKVCTSLSVCRCFIPKRCGWKVAARSPKNRPEAGGLVFFCFNKIPQMDGYQRGGEEIADSVNLWQKKRKIYYADKCTVRKSRGGHQVAYL